MGNAMSAVSSGDLAGYYNPALLPYLMMGVAPDITGE
jgi:hypothetical protein